MISFSLPDNYQKLLPKGHVLATQTAWPSALVYRGNWAGRKRLRILVDSGSTKYAPLNKKVPLTDRQPRSCARSSTSLLTGGGVIECETFTLQDQHITVQGARTRPRELEQCDLGDLPYDIVLGLPFLQQYDPVPKWRTGELKFKRYKYK